ncbi:MAG: hypothetical protein L3J43_02210 [Sulfurovum sp.]|nr:hypothetical protein [Sulfurovum sp.]
MKEKIKEIQIRMDNDPKLKEAVEKIKPKRNLWGITGIILFFFVPEIVTYIWNAELISWAHEHTLTEPLEIQRWLYTQLEKMFISGVSWLNISLGVGLLVWVLRSK